MQALKNKKNIPESTLHDNIKQKYLLSIGVNGEGRLNILNKVFNPYTYKFLENLDIKPGMRILEIGCGTGEIASWLSKKVGPQGQITAIDINKEQIEIALKNNLSSNVDNIKFYVMSAYDIESLKPDFDLIYCRFLLTHLSSPISVLNLAYKLLKTGGRLACEESTISASFCYPKQAAFTRWIKIWIGLKKLHKLPFDLGLKLPNMIREAGYSNICYSLVQPVLVSPEEKSLLRLNIIESLDYAIEDGLISHGEVNAYLKELEALENNEDLFIGFVRNTQISASNFEKSN